MTRQAMLTDSSRVTRHVRLARSAPCPSTASAVTSTTKHRTGMSGPAATGRGDFTLSPATAPREQPGQHRSDAQAW
jgi:hypothetical protein